MSKGEQTLKDFLLKEGIKYEPQKTIENIPFNRKNNHKVDFYIPSKNLYIEVKGQMTLFEVNVLKYLQFYADINLYIFQSTCEDWISPYEKLQDQSISQKLQKNVSLQLNEVLSLSTDELVALSKKRLEKYISFRNGDLDRWISYGTLR